MSGRVDVQSFISCSGTEAQNAERMREKMRSFISLSEKPPRGCQVWWNLNASFIESLRSCIRQRHGFDIDWPISGIVNEGNFTSSPSILFDAIKSPAPCEQKAKSWWQSASTVYFSNTSDNQDWPTTYLFRSNITPKRTLSSEWLCWDSWSQASFSKLDAYVFLRWHEEETDGSFKILLRFFCRQRMQSRTRLDD